MLKVKATDGGLGGRSFAVYINGNVAVNKTVNTQPVSAHNTRFFDISVTAQAVDLGNTAPKISAFQNNIELTLDQGEQEVVIGTPYDMQLNDFYVAEWGVKGSSIEEE